MSYRFIWIIFRFCCFSLFGYIILKTTAAWPAGMFGCWFTCLKLKTLSDVMFRQGHCWWWRHIFLKFTLFKCNTCKLRKINCALTKRMTVFIFVIIVLTIRRQFEQMSYLIVSWYFQMACLVVTRIISLTLSWLPFTLNSLLILWLFSAWWLWSGYETIWI